MYHCPSFAGPDGWVTYFTSGRYTASRGRHSLRLAEIRLASVFVLGGENTDRHMYGSPFGDAAGHVTNDIDQDDASTNCADFPGQDGGFLMHPGGNNLLFGDLHVQSFRAPDPPSMTYSVDAMQSWDATVPPAVAN